MALDIEICAHPWAYAARQPGCDIRPVLQDIFADFRAAGFDGIELMHTALQTEADLQRAVDLSAHYELPVIGASFGGSMWDRQAHSELLAHAEFILPALAELGGHLLGVSTGKSPEGRKTVEQLDIQAELLARLIDLGADHDITINLHNHTYEVEHAEYELIENLERIPNIKLGPDLNWLRRAAVAPLDFLRRHADCIVYLHLRDQQGDSWVEALGDGDEDYVQLGRVLSEIGFTGKIGIELAHEPDTVFTRSMGENFALSCRHLRAAFAPV